MNYILDYIYQVDKLNLRHLNYQIKKKNTMEVLITFKVVCIFH